MTDENLTLTRILEITDDTERSIIDLILQPVMENITVTFLNYWGSNNTNTENLGIYFIKSIQEVTVRLFKANKHRINYSTIEQLLYEKLKIEASKDKGVADLAYNQLELACEVDSFFTQYKSCLDSLIKTINPILDSNFKTFSKGDEKYPFKFMREIDNNKSSRIKARVEILFDFINNNSDNIKSNIKLRDSIVHFSSNKLSSFHFSKKKNKLYKPSLIISKNNVYDPEEYMKEALNELIKFAQYFICLSISQLEPNTWTEISQEVGFVWKINVGS